MSDRVTDCFSHGVDGMPKTSALRKVLPSPSTHEPYLCPSLACAAKVIPRWRARQKSSLAGVHGNSRPSLARTAHVAKVRVGGWAKDTTGAVKLDKIYPDRTARADIVVRTRERVVS